MLLAALFVLTAHAAVPAEVNVGDLVIVDGGGGSIVLRVVDLDGSTPAQAGAAVASLGSGVSVTAPVDPSNAVFVAGQVGRPGAVTYGEGLTLTQAITNVGGWTPTARLNAVTLLRGDEALRVDLRAILKGKEADLALQPGDRLVVNETVW